MKKKLLFVCTGNSCRSIIAEALMKKMLNEKGRNDIEIISAGTSAVNGFKPVKETVDVMKECEVDISEYFSKQITKEMICNSDLIFAMSEVHKNEILRILPSAGDKVRLIKEEGIKDPMGSSLDVYRDCVKEIKESLYRIMEEL